MNIYEVGHITFKTEREWVQLMPPYFILRFTLKQEGPHGEWMTKKAIMILPSKQRCSKRSSQNLFWKRLKSLFQSSNKSSQQIYTVSVGLICYIKM